MFEKYNHFTHWNSKDHFSHWNIPARKITSTVTSATRRQIYVQSQQKKHPIKASNLSKVYNKYNKTTSSCCFNESFKMVCRTKSLSSACLSVYLSVCLPTIFLRICSPDFSDMKLFFQYMKLGIIHEKKTFYPIY